MPQLQKILSKRPKIPGLGERRVSIVQWQVNFVPVPVRGPISHVTKVISVWPRFVDVQGAAKKPC